MTWSLLLACTLGAADVNALKGIEVLKTANGGQVVVTGTKAPIFTVFRLGEPDRLVVDVTGADVAAVVGHRDGVGPIAGVVASQFTNERSNVGRVLIALDGATRYDVKADGARLLISVEGKQTETAASPAPVKAEPAKVVAEAPKAAPQVEAPKASRQSAAVNEKGVIAAQMDEVTVKNPAHTLKAVRLKGEQLAIDADGEVASFELIELDNPPRLAIDLHDMSSAIKTSKASGGALKAVRIGVNPDKVRLVLDMKDKMPGYRASRTARGLLVTLSEDAAAKKADAAPQDSAGEAVVEIDGKPVQLEKDTEKAAAVLDVQFHESKTGGRLDLKLEGSTGWVTERPDYRSAVLTLKSASIPRRLERSLDTSDLETPVKMVSAFRAPGNDERVRVVVAAESAIEEQVVKTKEGLSWRIRIKGAKTEEAVTTNQAAGFSDEAEKYSEQGAPQKARYVGKRVTFEFKDIDIHNLLRIIAEISKKNIVVADDVGGKVTIRLRNVPWDQALELILRSKGLGKEEFGNIIRIAPLKTLEEEAKSRETRQATLRRAEPLTVRLVPVNYAVATDMKDRVKEVLSERGVVTVDTRTNTLIVRDIESNIARVQALVSNLDLQTPQVLIEGRIVEARTQLAKEVGIQWGGNATAAPAFGNQTGLAFPNIVAGAGAAGDTPNAGTTATPNWAVNLPAAIGQGSGGGLGFLFGSAGGAVQLNLRLSALESQGLVKVVSAPKVTTLDNQTAKISQGTSIPFSQVSAAGVNTLFVEARLSLEVTPHITSDGSVLLHINADKSEPDPGTTGANGQPAILRKQANTNVLVKDGDTTVIGGIYVKSTSDRTAGVPLLSKIPVLGFFFRHYNESEDRQELLIFITPRILNRTQMAQTL
ncbi:MAG: type IV pilus secretin PilQ [Archangiaceae bacterium]|nr:type IV pilus secretin PilQ [Archangiaceae bacterium]